MAQPGLSEVRVGAWPSLLPVIWLAHQAGSLALVPPPHPNRMVQYCGMDVMSV